MYRLSPVLREIIKKAVSRAIKETFPKMEMPYFSVEMPEHPEHGDYASNAGLALAKKMKKPPMEVADALARKVEDERWKTGIKNPGFINFFVSDSSLIEKLNAILIDQNAYGNFDFRKGEKITVEFTDPNPFKEFHIGHLYSNIVGEAISRIFKSAGAEVRRVNYQGDVGMHIAKALWGLEKKMREEQVSLKDLEQQPLREKVRFMGQAYAQGARQFEENPACAEEIAALNKKIFSRDPDIAELYARGRQWSLEYFEEIYRRLDTRFDYYYFESEVGPRGLALVKEYLERGIFEESEGAIVFPGEKYGLHRRVFVNRAGLPTYEAKELGLALKKHEDFPCDLSLIITGNEIIEYFKVLIAALRAINPRLAEKTKHISHGMVRLAHGKMSSRTGDVIRAEDLLDEIVSRVGEIMESSRGRTPAHALAALKETIALGAVKYSFLKIHLGKDVIFDFDASLSLEGDSGPYLQYTHARLKSVLRKAGEPRADGFSGVSLDPLEHRLLVSALRLPEAIEDAFADYAPHTLANYLYKLAQLANEFYHSHPVAQEPDEKKRAFRLALISVVALTLKKGLYLLGIEAPEEM